MIKIDKQLAPWTVFEHWHSKQSIEHLDDQFMLLSVPYNDDRELIADVMRLGHAAKIMQPESLQQQFQQQLVRILDNYR